jgi:hypothetical protein
VNEDASVATEHHSQLSARVRANRRNALRSTGPRTARGQAASSKNALKHGLLSREVILADEDAGAFGAFEEEMLLALVPTGSLERVLAERVIVASWRLRRFERIEAIMLAAGCQDWRGNDVGLGTSFVAACVNGDVFAKLSRYESGIERAFFRALHELQRLQAARTGEPVAPPVAVDLNVSRHSA